MATQLTDHFTLEEMVESNTAKIKNIKNIPDATQVLNLQRVCIQLEKLRQVVGPIKILSGYRSEALNQAVGGQKTSDHLLGCAADIVAVGGLYADQKALAKRIKEGMDKNEWLFGQLILEFYDPITKKGWVHVSVKSPVNANNRVITINSKGVSVGLN